VTRVVVCGGRRFAVPVEGKPADLVALELQYLQETLTKLHHKHKFALLIHGGASGADEQAGAWAKSKELPTLVFHAQWRKFGKDAGPLRNQQMLSSGRPDLVIAFPGGLGTKDMVKRAYMQNYTVYEAMPLESLRARKANNQ
jgi:predicted Rossmann-fold nucleotide-binding protein